MLTPQTIVDQARTWLGTKYHHQGRLKKTATSQGGVDCIGFVVGVTRELKITNKAGKFLSDFDYTNYPFYPDGVSLKKCLDQHLREVTTNEITLGDILLFKFFHHPQHVGIATDYQDNSLGIIHCHSGSGYVVEHVLSDAWRKMLVGAYRFKSCI